MRISPEQQQKAIKLYRNKNLTWREIANLCDISVPSLQKMGRGGVENGVLKMSSVKISPKHLSSPRASWKKSQSTTTRTD